MRVLNKLKQILNLYILKKKRNVTTVGKCKIDIRSTFEGYNKIGKNCIITNCKIGYASYISENTSIENVDVGRFCSIGKNLQIIKGRHPSKEFVSTHPLFFSISNNLGISYVREQKFLEHAYIDEESKVSVSIGNDVWIGDNVCIMEGCKIGDGAIIGTNSLVTRDIEPYSINVGMPAKVIKYRFNENQIKFLSDINWCQLDISWIKENADYFADIEDFIDNYKKQFGDE